MEDKSLYLVHPRNSFHKKICDSVKTIEYKYPRQYIINDEYYNFEFERVNYQFCSKCTDKNRNIQCITTKCDCTDCHEFKNDNI